MIKFERYPHIHSLLRHYADRFNAKSVTEILDSGVKDSQSAELFSLFVWQVVDAMHDDEESGVSVLGSTNNLEMIPDLEYEVSKYLRAVGFYQVWVDVSERA